MVKRTKTQEKRARSMEIHTYPEMNQKIKDILRLGDDPMCLYAAERIEELETLLAAAVKDI